MANIIEEIKRRRTFAIISHPDAGNNAYGEAAAIWRGYPTGRECKRTQGQ